MQSEYSEPNLAYGAVAGPYIGDQTEENEESFTGANRVTRSQASFQAGTDRNALNQAASFDNLRGQTINSFYKFDEATKSMRMTGFPSNARGIKGLRQQKEALREHTMRRIDTMGFKTPHAWKDELYRNELGKLDLKREILRNMEGKCKIENGMISKVSLRNETLGEPPSLT